jgi:hypothetical protein
MATPPTFVASYGNVAPISNGTLTASITVQAGDLIVVVAGTNEQSTVVTKPTGGGLTWAVQQSINDSTQHSNAYLWTATSPTAQTFTLSLSSSGGGRWTYAAYVWRNHGGVGSSAKKTATSTTSLSLSTQGANSALVLLNVDYNAGGGSRTYLTSGVGAFTENAYQLASGYLTFYSGYHADSGAVGSKTVGMSAPSGQRPSLIALEVLAAPVVASGSLSITATALSANVPPAVRVDINDTRSPGQAAALTVVRNDPDGTQAPVRTFDGNPLVLSSGVGQVYDYEMPLGAAVSYTTIEVPGISSLQVTATSSQVWLVHPGIPSKSQPVTNFMPGSFTKRTLPVVQGVFRPLGRQNAVVVTDGTRKGPESSFTILTTSDTQRLALESLISDASVLLVNVPASMGYNFRSSYVAIGNVDYGPIIDRVTETWMTWTLPVTTVDRPAGGSQSARTYPDILAAYGSYSAVQAHYKSYADVLAGP